MKDKWYNLEIETVMTQTNSSIDGLTNKEAKKRLEKYGKNELPKKKKDSVFKIFFRQMLDPIVILLIITIVFSLLINEVIDALAIMFIVVVDLIIGTYQEWKAEKTAESLSNLIKVKCKVLRDGEEIEITHRAYDKSIFASGALTCALALVNKQKGLFKPCDLT